MEGIGGKCRGGAGAMQEQLREGSRRERREGSRGESGRGGGAREREKESSGSTAVIAASTADRQEKAS